MAPGDSELWHSWIDRRDEAAFAALVTEHLGFATGLARRLGCSAADADDVTQRVLVRLAGETREKPAHVGIRAWLARDVLQESRKSSRSRVRRIRYEGKAPARETEGVEGVDVRDAVEAALGTLDERDRLAVELRFLHDLEYREVAFILGCSRLACRLRVHRAVKGMRRRLGRDASLIVASWPRLSDTPPDAGARIASAIAATRTAVPASTALFVLGGIIVGKKMIAVAAGLLLLLGGVSYVLVAGDGGGRVVAQERPPVALAVERRNASPDAHTLAPGRPATSDPAVVTAPASVADPTKGALEVLAFGRDGVPLPDEPFSFSRGGDPPNRLRYRSGRTGVDGHGRLDGLEPGTAWVRLGHGPGVAVEISAGGIAQAELRLTRGLDVEGVVVDPLGAPVVGAEVWIDVGMTRSTTMMAVAKTEAGGRFAIKDVDPSASVSARAVGYSPSLCRHLRLGKGKTETVRLVLGGPGTTVRGRVEDASRSPVAGALLVIGNTRWEAKELPGGGQGTEALPFLTFTADDGTFAADGLPVGMTSVTVRAHGLGPYRAVRELLAGPAPNDWTIVLSPGVSIQGVVVDEAGAPVMGAYVMSFQDWGNPGRWSAETDAAGRFTLDDVPVDHPVSLRAAHEVDGVGTFSGHAKAGPPGSIAKIVLHPPLVTVVMRVRVMDEHGSPIVDRRVHAWTSAGTWGRQSEPTDADGRTTLNVPEQETYELWVTDPEGEGSQPSSRLRGVRPGRDEVTLTVGEIDRPSSRIVGRAVTLDGHLPDGARAWAVPLVGGTRLNLSLDAASGRFESKRLQAGRYELLLSAGWVTLSLGRVRVASQQTLDVGDVRLDSMGSLVVKLRGPGPAELLGSRKAVLRAEGPRGGAWAPLGPDGTARFGFLPPGRYWIIGRGWLGGASPAATGSASVLIKSGEEASLELPVTPGHVRHIRVQGLAADDVPGLTVQVHAEGEDAVVVDWPFPQAPRDGEPDAQGAFAPGRYVAEAETADGRRASASFEVRGDGEPPVIVAGFK